MKYIIAILLIAIPFTDLDKIAKVNELKKKAKTAYNKGEFKTAVKHYNYLLDSMKVEDDNISLNLANAYYQLKDSSNAVNNYSSLLRSKDNTIKSVAHQQLGIMADRAKKFEEALEHFKDAIRANPTNDEARYNYEMLKKMLDKKKQEEQNKDNKDQNKEDQKKDQENKDQQNKDQQKQDQKDKDGKEKENKEKQEQQDKEGEKSKEEQQKEQEKKDGEKSEEEKPKLEEGEQNDEKKKGEEEQMESVSDKLKEMKISEEKAKMIMEALKNNEIQYIQQNKRKPTKRKDSSKPDW